MKYASEHVGVLTSVHQWKPVPPERFTHLLHFYSTKFSDRYGHEALHTTAIALDRDATATVIYRRKGREDSVSLPVLMTMEGPGGKTLCFETTNGDYAVEPEAAAAVIRDACAFRDRIAADKLAAVAKRAGSTGLLIIIAPTDAGHGEVFREMDKLKAFPNSRQFYTIDQIANLSIPEGVSIGFWLHNMGSVGQAVLGAVMHRVAEAADGRGWMAFTGNSPMGYVSPEGLPKERV